MTFVIMNLVYWYHLFFPIAVLRVPFCLTLLCACHGDLLALRVDNSLVLDMSRYPTSPETDLFSRVQELRSKACPPTRWGDFPAGQIDGPCQGQVERCLALLRPVDPTPRENVISGSGALSESHVDRLGDTFFRRMRSCLWHALANLLVETELSHGGMCYR